MPSNDITFWFDVGGVVLAGIGLAFISLIEAALVSVNRIRLHQLAEQGHPTAPIAERLISQPQELLGGLVVMINVFVLLAANLTTAAARRYWGPNAVVWANFVVLVALLVFGEVTPKTLSVHFAERIALRTARLAAFMNAVLSPIISVITGISFGILRILTALHILPGRVHAVPNAFSEEDIKQLVTAGEQSGEVEATEREMIHGVIEFADTTAHEIMVPRTDLVALPVESTVTEAIDLFTSSGHSRIPVFEENVDNIIGLLYVKDLLIHLHAAKHAEARRQIAIRDFLRSAYFVPESKKSDDLLREMQRKQVHMAIVVDEYGGTAGIITIEDLLEEIVGDIIDEYDQERLDISIAPDGSALIDGRTSLEKVHETLDFEIPEDTDAETISGLITEQLGRIPEQGDCVVISGVDFSVLEVIHNRVTRLRAVILPTEGPSADQD